MTAEQIGALARTLDEARARDSSQVYQGAQHGYTMADTPAYEAARERQFRELRALLERTLRKRRELRAGMTDVGPEFESPRYPRILVAIDETQAAVFALRHVVPYAVDQRSQLTLLTVVPNPPAAVAAAGMSPRRLGEELESQSAARLRQLTASLPQDLSVTTVLRHGDPAEEILRLAREQPVDLICMGARGHGRIGGALLGSVSTAVLHHSPVPVVVLHPPPDAASDG